MNSPYPVTKKILKKGKEVSETEYVRNADKKKKFMESFHLKTEDDFIRKVSMDKNWKKFIAPEFPKRYSWLWFTFLDLWRTCGHDFNGNVILTPGTLMDYCRCFLVNLSVYEKHLVFRMKGWAEDEIYSLKKKD